MEIWKNILFPFFHKSIDKDDDKHVQSNQNKIEPISFLLTIRQMKTVNKKKNNAISMDQIGWDFEKNILLNNVSNEQKEEIKIHSKYIHGNNNGNNINNEDDYRFYVFQMKENDVDRDRLLSLQSLWEKNDNNDNENEKNNNNSLINIIYPDFSNKCIHVARDRYILFFVCLKNIITWNELNRIYTFFNNDNKNKEKSNNNDIIRDIYILPNDKKIVVHLIKHKDNNNTNTNIQNINEKKRKYENISSENDIIIMENKINNKQNKCNDNVRQRIMKALYNNNINKKKKIKNNNFL